MDGVYITYFLVEYIFKFLYNPLGLVLEFIGPKNFKSFYMDHKIIKAQKYKVMKIKRFKVK